MSNCLIFPTNASASLESLFNHLPHYNYSSNFSHSGICAAGFIGSLGHPTSCAKFYKCDKEGLAYEHSCPDNLLFDVKSKNCNWPEEVNCLLGGGGGGGGGGAVSGQATQQVLPPKQTNIKQTQNTVSIGTRERKEIYGG